MRNRSAKEEKWMTHGNRYDNVSRCNRDRREPGNLFNSAADLLYLLHDRELEYFFKGRRAGLEIPDPVLQCLYGVKAAKHLDTVSALA